MIASATSHCLTLPTRPTRAFSLSSVVSGISSLIYRFNLFATTGSTTLAPQHSHGAVRSPLPPTTNKHGKTSELTEQELNDLIEYVKAL